MYDKEKEMETVLYSGMMYAMEGIDPSKAIEDQERRGQENLINSCCLPKVTTDHKVPRNIREEGVRYIDDFDTRFKKMKSNNANYIRSIYSELHIKIVSEEDDLFYNVELPKGWKLQRTDHSMWSNLIDDKGRKRASIFYKAAFYDRDAFIVFNTRYTLSAGHTANSEEDYELWEASNYQGVVKDGDTVIYKTEEVAPTGSYSEDMKIKDDMMKELKKYMDKEYPDYENILAYWEDDIHED